MRLLETLRKYEYQCDLVYAILGLSPSFRNTDETTAFFRKWMCEGFPSVHLDKHLYHGLNLLLQLASEASWDLNALPDRSSSFCESFQRSIEINNLLFAAEAAHLTQLFSQAGVPLLPLKGASYYFSFEDSYFQTRLATDIDLLIPKKHLAEARYLLEKDGYRAASHTAYRYSSQKTMEQNFYACDFSKTAGAEELHIDLHWAIPTGPVSSTSEGLFYASLPEEETDCFFQESREIEWNGRKILLPSARHLFYFFLWNVHVDFAGQVNIIRLLHAAKDFFELRRLLPAAGLQAIERTLPSSCQATFESLSLLVGRLFGREKNAPPGNLKAFPKLLYSALKPIVPKRRHALEAWLAIYLSRQVPILFKTGCLCHILCQNTFQNQWCRREER